MIPLNYNYYGIPIGREASAQWDSSVKLGSLTNRTMLEEQDKHGRGKAFDESIYLWKIKPSASFACNAAFNISTGNTLNIDIAINRRDNPVSLAVGTVVSQSTAPGVGFYTAPKDRIGYDELKATTTQRSNLCYDIPYNRYCLFCGIQCLDYDSSPLATVGQSLSTLKAYIDNNNADVVFLRCDLYTGIANDRRISNIYADASEEGYSYPYYESIIADILTDRPIPDSATLIKNYIKDGHADYIDTVVYSPFTTAIKRNWYQSRVTAINQLLNIGIHAVYDYSTLRTGAQTISGADKVTGQFMKVSTDEQIFDDVCYKWVLKWYDDATGAILENGYDITSRTGGGRLISVLTITDDKGQTKGEAVTRAVKHELAFIGFYFADNQTLAMSGTLGSSGDGVGIYLPEKIGGVTTGNYFTGDDIKNVPYADADSVGGFPYDPVEVEGDEGDFSTALQSGALSAGTVYYALSDTELKDLLRYLNTTYSPDETTLAEDFKGANPFEYITSVKYYPFCLPYAVAQQINVGPIATGVTGYILPYTYGNTSYSFFDMGSFTFTPRYNNFLDYSGTQINLYLPWCGTQQLDPAMWIASPGQQPITLNIKYSFDYVTGAVTAFLFRDSMLIDTADGQVGIDIPMSALATGSYQQQIAQAQIAYKQAATSTTVAWLGLVGSMIGTAVAAASGVGAPAAVAGVVGIASSAGQLIKSSYQEESVSYTLDHTSPNVGSVSAASPFNAAIFDQRPRILISRPQLQQLPTNWAENYGKSVGYACSIPTKLNNAAIKGLTVVQAPRLQGIKKVIGSQTYTPTREELDLIRQAMAEGIIL